MVMLRANLIAIGEDEMDSEIVFNTDDVLQAIANDDSTYLYFKHQPDLSVVISLPFNNYCSIVLGGVEHLSSYVKMVS